MGYLSQLDRLFEQLLPLFNAPEQAEIQAFVEVNEYGLAFDSAMTSIFEENIRLDEVAFSILLQLASLLELDVAMIRQRLLPFTLGV